MSSSGGETRSGAIRVWKGVRLGWPGRGWVVSASCRLPKHVFGASVGDGRRGEGSVLVYLYNDVGRRWRNRKQQWKRNRPPCGDVMGKRNVSV